jgi:heptosyltransferase-1
VQTYFRDTTLFVAKGIAFTLTEQEKQQLQTITQEILKDRSPVWMVCFGSRWKNKQLPLASWIALFDNSRKTQAPFFVFVYGNKEEKKIAEQLQSHVASCSVLCPPMSLPLWQHVMQECDLVLSVDSAALHLCATTQTPSWGFFGASSARAYNPPGKQHLAIQGVCPYGQQFHYRCPRLRSCPTGACMHDPALLTLSSK